MRSSLSLHRRAFLGGLILEAFIGGALVWPRVARGQQGVKVRRIGHLAASAPSAENSRLLAAFHAEPRERGWVEGRNIAFEYRWAEGRYDRLPELAARLKAAKALGLTLPPALLLRADEVIE